MGGSPGTAWPLGGPYDLVLLRLAKAKDEVEMAVHAAASVLTPGGALYVYGAKDEGIGSASRRVEGLMGPVRTVATGGRCRVLAAERPHEGNVRDTLEQWRVEMAVDLPEIEGPWSSYPGVFAHGRVDRGTALLLDCLPPLKAGARVLDFGCGSGLVAGVTLARSPGVELDCLDVDAVALEAVRRNVPQARTILADGTSGLPARTYDAVLSNPPYHAGKAETTAPLEALVLDCARILMPRGGVTLVAQRRLPVGAWLETAFGVARVLAEDGTYRVWSARRPREPAR